MDTTQVRQAAAKALYEAGFFCSEDGAEDTPECCSPSLNLVLDFICNNPVRGKSEGESAIYWATVLHGAVSTVLERLQKID